MDHNGELKTKKNGLRADLNAYLLNQKILFPQKFITLA